MGDGSDGPAGAAIHNPYIHRPAELRPPELRNDESTSPELLTLAWAAVRRLPVGLPTKAGQVRKQSRLGAWEEEQQWMTSYVIDKLTLSQAAAPRHEALARMAC